MDSLVVRLLDDGTRDSTLSGDGLVSLAFSGAPEKFKGVPIRSDAKIITVGIAPIGTTRNPIDNVLVVRYLVDPGSSCRINTLLIRDRL
jgi:hypothetical protein